MDIAGKQRPQDEHDQPLPVASDSPYMQDLVIADIQKRLAVGIKRYGRGLQANNGRDMLTDWYEELMDACIYARGLLYERDGK